MEETQRTARQAGPPASEWTRVILLAPAQPEAGVIAPSSAASSLSAGAISDELAAEFQRRDWFVIVQHDPYLALAELALRERAQAARAAWGLQRMEGLALVVIEPARWPSAMLGDLIASVRRWLPPSVTIWTAENNRIEQVAPNDPPLSGNIAQTSVQQALSMEALIAALPRDSANVAHTNGSTEVSTVLRPAREAAPERLSREEIDMLLHEDDSASFNVDRTSPEAGS